MRIEVKLYVGGKVFSDVVEAVNLEDAKVTAKARYPRAKIIALNWIGS